MLRVLDIAPPDAYSSLAYPSSVIDDALKRAAVCFHPDKRRRHSPTLGLSMDRIWEMYKEAAVVAKLGPTFQSISSSNCPIEKSNRHMEAAAKFLEIPRYTLLAPADFRKRFLEPPRRHSSRTGFFPETSFLHRRTSTALAYLGRALKP
jgi:hypothetical protein